MSRGNNIHNLSLIYTNKSLERGEAYIASEKHCVRLWSALIMPASGCVEE